MLPLVQRDHPVESDILFDHNGVVGPIVISADPIHHILEIVVAGDLYGLRNSISGVGCMRRRWNQRRRQRNRGSRNPCG